MNDSKACNIIYRMAKTTKLSYENWPNTVDEPSEI